MRAGGVWAFVVSWAAGAVSGKGDSVAGGGVGNPGYILQGRQCELAVASADVGRFICNN